MNKRTISQPFLHLSKPSKKSNKAKVHPSILQTSKTLQELADLKSKVTQSRPILESIYDKMKRKEQGYQQKLSSTNQQCQKAHLLTRQYKSAFNDALKIIDKNKVMDQYQGLTNYRSLSANQLNLSSAFQEDQRKIMNYQSVGNLLNNAKESDIRIRAKNIVSEYISKNMKGTTNEVKAPFFGQSVYDRYKRKIEGSGDSKKQNRESTLNKARRLSREFDKDIQELKVNRDRSLKSLQTKKTPLELNPKKKDKREYFLELQKRKLKNM